MFARGIHSAIAVLDCFIVHFVMYRAFIRDVHYATTLTDDAHGYCNWLDEYLFKTCVGTHSRFFVFSNPSIKQSKKKELVPYNTIILQDNKRQIRSPSVKRTPHQKQRATGITLRDIISSQRPLHHKGVRK